MKKICLLGVLITGICLTGCKSLYKCGDPVPAKKGVMGKRLKAVVNERDLLCNRISENDSIISSLIDDTTRLFQEGLAKDRFISELGQANARLQNNYEALQNDRISDAEKFNLALKQKSDELALKEKALAEREQSLKQLQDALNKKEETTAKLNEAIRNALLGFRDDELSVEERDGKVYVSLSNKLLFTSGSATVGEQGQQALQKLADVMLKNPDIDIEVEGHTDNDQFRTRTTADTDGRIYVRDNWDLSVMRATSVVKVLTDEYSVDPKRVRAAGRGEFFPKADNSSAEGKAKNRRTEIVLTPKLDEVMKLLKKK
ncbi:MAG: OmpA family protein [Paludibacteraceae bacterium]|nr:OmpA family protein [Paludibacteraceae bacterium]